MTARGAGGSSRLDAIGLIAALAMIAGPALAWLRMLSGMAGFALYVVAGLVAVAMGVSALVQSARGRKFGAGRSLALVAAMVFIITAAASRHAPPINDFTTDLDDPPAFVHALSLPANSGRDMSYPRPFAEQQQACCADLRPARLPVGPEEALARARRTAESMPSWEVVAVDPQAGTIEAVATTKVFGFHDDIAIRVRPEGTASRVDVRSKSRDGRGDLGANAERIRIFVGTLEAAG